MYKGICKCNRKRFRDGQNFEYGEIHGVERNKFLRQMKYVHPLTNQTGNYTELFCRLAKRNII